MDRQELKVQEITSEFDPADVSANKTNALLSYLSILVIIPILNARDSKFAMFHANQGLVLAIVEIVASIILGIVAWIPVIGFFVSLPSYTLYLVSIILAVMGILDANNGRARKLPVIGSITLIK